MLTNCQSNSAKKASNTNRHNLASNNMEYHKLKSSTQTLHVINRKAALCINYAFQKIARYIELENF